MPRARLISGSRLRGGVSLGDLLTARPTGLTEPEAWAILCQAVQALQDLFLSDGASGGTCIPLITPSTLLLSSRGRVKLYQNPVLLGCGPPNHLTGYLAPEYRPNKQCSDTETEKMWIYGLGETLKRATLTSHAATSRLSGELCQVLTDMTRPQASARASLMHLLDIISEYCKKRQQNRPFSHIVMDLHQEALAELEAVLESPWGLQAMPEIKTRTVNRCDTINTDTSNILTLPRRWMGINRSNPLDKPKLTREASTSMEDLSFDHQLFTPGSVLRPKSMCVPLESHPFKKHNEENYLRAFSHGQNLDRLNYENLVDTTASKNIYWEPTPISAKRPGLARSNNLENPLNIHKKKGKVRRNPVQRAASRLYRASDVPRDSLLLVPNARDCVGPEFVVRAALPSRKVTLPDCKGHVRKTVTVIMLNGQKLDITCNPNTTTAGQLFELIIQKEHIEENFMLGLSALIAGDFVFLPSDARICKAVTQGGTQGAAALTLFVRVRFFLPGLRGIRSLQARHLLYLQLRRSVLEYQLPCNYNQLIEFGGLALQAEFGDFIEKEHGTRDYFLLEHYVPETVTCNMEENKRLRQELTRAHIGRRSLDKERAEEDFMVLAQNMPHYGGHFYTATWALKDNTQKDVWLYISAQGINLYERNITSHQWNPILLEMFEWRTIQTLCYSKHYLCILPHSTRTHGLKLKKYKLKMDHKKSYFTFRLASLHHQFFLRLRTQYTSLNSLSEQFGVQLKDMKNETNSLYKLEALTNPLYMLDSATVSAETEFKIEFCASSKSSLRRSSDNKCKRSKSISDFGAVNDYLMIEEYQNKENENPQHYAAQGQKGRDGLILDSSYLSGLPNSNVWDKRRGVKMGVRAFANNGQRVSRSMEAVNALTNDDLEQLSLQSTSLHCSSTSISRSPVVEYKEPQDAYILDSSIKSCGNYFMPDFQETLSESFLEKLNNFSFAEERILQAVSIERDLKGSLGLQIMEGSDGKVYIQSVIPGGPAHVQGNITTGDQIVAVNGRNLLSMKYNDALELLKTSGSRVEFVLAQISVVKSSIHAQATLPISEMKSKQNSKCQIDLSNINESHMKSVTLESTMNKLKRMSYPNTNFNYANMMYGVSGHVNTGSPIEKHTTESCHDITNPHKFTMSTSNLRTDVPYHKHIRYDLEADTEKHSNLNKSMSKSCTQIYARETNDRDRAVIVDMIPKLNINLPLSELYGKVDEEPNEEQDTDDRHNIPPIPLPRSLGLSRKWRGPVRYPVTPVKKCVEPNDDSSAYVTTSDEELIAVKNKFKSLHRGVSGTKGKPTSTRCPEKQEEEEEEDDEVEEDTEDLCPKDHCVKATEGPCLPPPPKPPQVGKSSFLGAIGPKQIAVVVAFIPGLFRYGVAALVALVYVTEFKTVLQYLPFYSGKYYEAEDVQKPQASSEEEAVETQPAKPDC